MTGSSLRFAPRLSVEEIEEGGIFTPKFDENGLIPVVTTDARSGEVLMTGVMNADTLLRTIESGEAHYWSRSCKCLRRKGATSGLIQSVVELRVVDDQDALWLRVEVSGGAQAPTSAIAPVSIALSQNIHGKSLRSAHGLW